MTATDSFYKSPANWAAKWECSIRYLLVTKKYKVVLQKISISFYYLLAGGAQLGAPKDLDLESSRSLDWEPCWSQLNSSGLITEGDWWFPCQGCCRAMARGAAACCLLMPQPEWPAALVVVTALVCRKHPQKDSSSFKPRMEAKARGLRACRKPRYCPVLNLPTNPATWRQAIGFSMCPELWWSVP